MQDQRPTLMSHGASRVSSAWLQIKRVSRIRSKQPQEAPRVGTVAGLGLRSVLTAAHLCPPHGRAHNGKPAGVPGQAPTSQGVISGPGLWGRVGT